MKITVYNLVRNPIFIKHLPKCKGLELELLFNLIYLQDLDHNIFKLTKETKPYLYDLFKQELEDAISKSKIDSSKAQDYPDSFDGFGTKKVYYKAK